MNKIIIAILLILTLSFIPFASSLPAGANVVNGTISTSVESSSEVLNISAGQVVEVNISGFSVTTEWAGFYGSIVGEVQLNDGSKDFYRWTVTDMTGSVVYAANSSVSNWGTLVAANISNIPSHIIGDFLDNYTNTFNDTKVFNKASGPITNTSYAITIQEGVADSLETYSLYVDSSTCVWAGLAQNGVNSFKGSSVDYQILVPSEEASDTPYNFYLELP